MTWKAILKMPVPLDTDTNRDTDYTAAITQYEKDIIEPVLTQYVNSQPAGVSPNITIKYDKTRPTDVHRDGIYVIGSEGIAKMGDNLNFMLDRLATIYEQEGYTVNYNTDEIQITKPQ